MKLCVHVLCLAGVTWLSALLERGSIGATVATRPSIFRGGEGEVFAVAGTHDLDAWVRPSARRREEQPQILIERHVSDFGRATGKAGTPRPHRHPYCRRYRRAARRPGPALDRLHQNVILLCSRVRDHRTRADRQGFRHEHWVRAVLLARRLLSPASDGEPCQAGAAGTEGTSVWTRASSICSTRTTNSSTARSSSTTRPDCGNIAGSTTSATVGRVTRP
jgi:hypothetical protein